MHAACPAGVRRLALFHHDPLRDDEALDRIVESASERLRAFGSSLDLFAAAEGQVVNLGGHDAMDPDVAEARGSTATDMPPARLAPSVLIAVQEPDTAVALSEAAQADGL